MKCHLPYCGNPARFTFERAGDEIPLCTAHARYYEPAHKLKIIDGESQNAILDIMSAVENEISSTGYPPDGELSAG